jgi:cob(I)alamin adenosyltransferase
MLFTGKGDGGTTRVFGCDDRISKASPLPEALGALDELNSFVGLCKVRAKQVQDSGVVVSGATLHTSEILRDVQETLFIIQAEVAGAPKSVGKEKVDETDAIVHAIEQELPPITTFSIPGGTELSALLDVARAISRRTERRLVAATESGRALGEHTKAYANRLSSLLFALARLANHKSGISEEAPSYK